ncbi:MAG TPA: hypothetical protein DD671_15080 [Balneolaceae bacterium]|nr:hypothetical protein [Balneolaceae bacterium]
MSSLNPHVILGVVLITSILMFPTNGTKRKILSKLGLNFDFGPNNVDDIHKKAKREKQENLKTTSEPVS